MEETKHYKMLRYVPWKDDRICIPLVLKYLGDGAMKPSDNLLCNGILSYTYVHYMYVHARVRDKTDFGS